MCDAMTRRRASVSHNDGYGSASWRFAAADQASLARIIKRKLKKIHYRPHLIDGCLAGTGLTIEPW